MTLLLNLYLGHLLGDFVFQPGRLVAAKREGLPGLLIHTSIIGICTAAILIGQLASFWNVILLGMAAHLSIEVMTIKLRASGRLTGLSVFLIDQAMHILSLVTLVALATSVNPIESITTFGIDLDPPWIALACALIGATFMGSIIIFEVLNAIGPQSWNRDILPYDRGRILGMVERASALLLATLIHPAIIWIPFVPRVILAWRGREDERARQMITAAVGLVVCVAGWALVALVSLAAAPTQ